MPLPQPKKVKSVLIGVTKAGTQFQVHCIAEKQDIEKHLDDSARNGAFAAIHTNNIEQMKDGSIVMNQTIYIDPTQLAFYTINEVHEPSLVLAGTNGIVSIEDIKRDKRVQ